MKSLTKILSTAAIGATMLIPTSADASNSWNNYHWERSSSPAQLTVGNNVSAAWAPYLMDAVGDWDESSVLAVTEVSGKAKGQCRAQSGRIEVCSDFYGNTGWLGVASISLSGSHITSGTSKMNDTYFSTAQYDTPAWRQLVMCQEIGHNFGLDHQDERFDNPNLGTCMDYTSDPAGNEQPDQHDYAQLEMMYAHLDTDAGSGGGGKPCNPKKPGCINASSGSNGLAGSDSSSPGEWGQLVRSNGRNAVFVRDFGNGNRVVTFVIWA